MFKNYFTIAWRNLVKTKGYSFINIGGLALGMSVALIIGLWVNDELSFNKYHDNYDQIAQVMKAGSFQGKHYSGQNYLQYPMLHELQTTYGANFKYVVPRQGKYEAILSIGDKKISKTGTPHRIQGKKTVIHVSPPNKPGLMQKVKESKTGIFLL